MLAAPMPIISWLGSTSSPRRAAKRTTVAIVSVSETRVMPTAAISSGPTSLSVRPREATASGVPAAVTDGREWSARPKHGRGDGGADHRDETAGTVLVSCGQHEQDDEHAEPTTSAAACVSSRLSKNAWSSSRKPSASVEKPNSFGQLADDDRDRQAVHVADLDLARQQVGDEPELADAEADLDEADDQARACRRARSRCSGRRWRPRGRSPRRSAATPRSRGRARGRATARRRA